MTEETREIITEDAAAPRWVGIVIVALAVVSLVALGAGWTASTRSRELEQNLASQSEQVKKNEDVLSQRLAKSEDTNAQLQGELSVVTDKMKLTEKIKRVARDVVQYQVTVEDPLTYVHPFTLSLPWTPLAGGILLPYECSEQAWLDYLDALKNGKAKAPAYP